MTSLGSLQEFLPGINTLTDFSSGLCSKQLSVSKPTYKKSLNGLGLRLSTSFCMGYLATSIGGYCFNHRILDIQEKFNKQKKSERLITTSNSAKTKVKEVRKNKTLSITNKKIKNNAAGDPVNLFEAGIRNELQYLIFRMKNEHFLMRTMRKQKFYEEGSKGFKSNLFNHFANSLLNSDHSNKVTHNSNEGREVFEPINSANAKEKLHQQRMSSWLTKQHKQHEKKILFHDFVIDFFKDLSFNEKNKLNGEKLLESLIFLGIGSYSTIKKNLCLVYKCKNLKDLTISSSDFANLFKPDIKVDKILKKLDEISIENRKTDQKT